MNFPTAHNVRMTIQNYEFMDHLPSMICPFLGQLSHLGGTDIFMKVMVVTDTRRVWGRVLSSLNIRMTILKQCMPMATGATNTRQLRENLANYEAQLHQVGILQRCSPH